MCSQIFAAYKYDLKNSNGYEYGSKEQLNQTMLYWFKFASAVSTCQLDPLWSQAKEHQTCYWAACSNVSPAWGNPTFTPQTDVFWDSADAWAGDQWKGHFLKGSVCFTLNTLLTFNWISSGSVCFLHSSLYFRVMLYFSLSSCSLSAF